jgi:hypothetical protein
LTILKPRKLFGIAEDEFNLKAQFVILDDLVGVLPDIGREQQTGANPSRMTSLYQVGNSNGAFERDRPDDGSVQVNLWLYMLDEGEATGLT